MRATYIRNASRILGLGLTCLVSLATVSFGETIGNLAYWQTPGVFDGYANTEMAIAAWNSPVNPGASTVSAPTVGQVITAPGDGNTVLRSFSVAMPASPVGFQTNMTVALFAWDQSSFRPVGSALASVSASTVPTAGTIRYPNDFFHFTFTPDVQLSPGQEYVVVYSTLGSTQPWSYENTSFGVTYRDTYSGGEMVFASAGALHESVTPLSTVETERWGKTGSCDELQLSTLCLGPAQGFYYPYPDIVARDLAFSADFEASEAPVPEPASLSVIGIIFMACWYWTCRVAGPLRSKRPFPEHDVTRNETC